MMMVMMDGVPAAIASADPNANGLLQGKCGARSELLSQVMKIANRTLPYKIGIRLWSN